MIFLRDVELDLAEILEAAELALSMTNTPPDLYAGPFPSSAPDRMIAVQFGGGDSSEDYLNSGASVFTPDAQVTVRGPGNAYKATLDLALAAFAALHLPKHAAYGMIKSDGAGPLYVGTDENGRHVFEFDVSCLYTVAR